MKKRIISLITAVCLLLCPLKAFGQEQQKPEEMVQTEAPSVMLLEVSTGTVLSEKNAREQRSPASITKIMTLLLIFEELEKGNLTMEEEVVTSAHAKSMGGSQVYLEEGEKQTVETMIKCIVVASGNDASVAMAEHIAGSEEEFVKRMNQRAKS
ncbi:MAG: D-alanyl-D-alanine carboxypeptidase, partial [Clostridiales bacterium]|nr:D-alanyl-D-alanine carboxypeptidase [Clostridiales bacterium]